ncbi:MAG TPA: POTRA domain-containing protein [Candidatus Sulfotelmatobacter sp.]|nr:POTRA domain-containing protein [Candidatus Sulfotelmatobacter sp.]
MMRALSTFLMLGALASAAPCFSQGQPIGQMGAAARQLIAIKVTGSQRFSEEAIAASTGLQLGTAAGEDDFKKAARRLGDTGAFSEIAFNYNYSAAGTRLELHVTDATKFVPAKFEDFVWFSDADLKKQIQQHVPLFNGELPLSGRMADEVSDVLQALLVEKGVPGHVDYERVGKTDGPVEYIEYKVSEVLIRIRKIEFTGAGEAELPALEEAGRNLPERGYSRARLQVLVDHDLLPILRAHGYLKAAIGAPEPKPVTQASAEGVDEMARNQSMVDVVFPVTMGEQYKFKSLEWSGVHELAVEQLSTMVRVQPGQPANTVRLMQDLKEVQKLYGSRGYLTAKLKANSQFDDAAGTVAITVQVTEGPVFHMGELQFRGLDNSLTAKLRDAWKLRAGDVYNAAYLDEYLPAARKLLPSTLDWDVDPHVTANLHDQSVDVDLVYSVKAPR